MVTIDPRYVEVAEEAKRQIMAFEQSLGNPVKFYDGYHIHVDHATQSFEIVMHSTYGPEGVYRMWTLKKTEEGWDATMVFPEVTQHVIVVQ